MKKKLIVVLIIVFVIGLFLRFGLPLLVTAMGLHPEYEGQRYLLPEKKALIIVTSQGTLGDNGKKTGVFGSEFTAPYYEFTDGRMSVDIASIKGGKAPIDPISFRWFVKSTHDDRYLSDPDMQKKMNNTLKVDDIDFTRYDIIYLAGGWGAAYDLGFSKVLGDKISDAYHAGKVIGGVCHGPLGLLQAYDKSGTLLIKGRRITAVTDKQVEELGITMTPQHPERELRAAGVKFESKTAFRDMFANHIVVDGRIVTGQNQNAGTEVANKMMMAAGGTRR